MERRSWNVRRGLTVGSAAMVIACGTLPFAGAPVAGQDAEDALAFAKAVSYLAGTWPEVDDIAPVPRLADPVGDATGTLPTDVPEGISDIEAAVLLTIPAGNLGTLEGVCSQPPEGLLLACPPDGLGVGDITLAIMRMRRPLPRPWTPVEELSLYMGLNVNSTAKTSDDLTDPFHAGTEAVYSQGLGAGGFVPFIEGLGNQSRPPLVGYIPDLGVGIVGMPTGELRNGFRPFASLAGPPGGVAQGVWDQASGPGDPVQLLMPTTPYDMPNEQLRGLLGVIAETSPSIAAYEFLDPTGDVMNAGTTSDPGGSNDPIDFLRSDGILLQPAQPPDFAGPFPCDVANGQGAFTACATEGAATGPFVVVRGTLGDQVPLDGTRTLVFGALFDGDGDPETGSVATADAPDDTYQGTDRWYELIYLPEDRSWGLVVTDQTAKDADRGNATASSGARAIVDGGSVTWVIPQAEFATPLPNWRITSAFSDDTTTPATVGVDVSSGGPGSTWALQPLADPAGLVVIVPPKPAVTGGCVVSEPVEGFAPVQLAWTIELEGIDGIEGMENPTADMKISYKGGSAEATGIPLRNGTITFDQAASVGKISFDSLVIQGGRKPVNLSKSWRKVFGKSLKVTAKGGQEAGPDCP